MKTEPLFVTDPSIEERIMIALTRGASFDIAAHYAGVDPETFRKWRKKGKMVRELEDEERKAHAYSIYYDFWRKCQKMRAIAACTWLQKIDDAANVHWQAAAWKLERAYPETYGRTEKVTITNDRSDVEKAKEAVTKLKSENNGRSTESEG